MHRIFKSQQGMAPLLGIVILFVLSLGVFLAVKELPKETAYRSQAAPAQTNPNKIIWQGQAWDVTGVNVPWFNWGRDFGGGAGNGGVQATRTELAARFQQLKDSGIHMVRWWVFPGDPWQIQRDAAGAPTTINTAVYADFDAAIELANQYDLYFNFVLFNGATAPPSSWLTNATNRTKLAQALTPLFARYANNPRVMIWEIYNEPEFQIWNNQIDEASVTLTADAIADAVHANSNALVTVGNAFTDGIPMWNNVSLDFYSPHWYDYMSGGNFCMRCNDYNFYKNLYNLTKPIVVGEMYAGPETDALQRFVDFRNKGFAGAWAWSLFYDHTSDLLQVDLNAMRTFASARSDVGPKVTGNPTSTPTPTPTVAPTPTSTVAPTPTPTVAPTPTPSGAPVSLSLTPATQTVGTNVTFPVQIRVNSGTSPVNALQANVTYDATKLDVVTIDHTGTAFTVTAEEILTSGSIKLGKGNITAVTGDKLVATINFRSKAGAQAQAQATFATTSEVISSQTNQNILTTRNGGTYTIQVRKPGDVNLDGVVNITDLSMLLTDFGTTAQRSDFNGNGTVDITDLSILLTNYGT